MSGFKQKWSIVLATAVSMAMLSACGDEEKEPSPKGEAKEVKILAFSAAPQVFPPANPPRFRGRRRTPKSSSSSPATRSFPSRPTPFPRARWR